MAQNDGAARIYQKGLRHAVDAPAHAGVAIAVDSDSFKRAAIRPRLSGDDYAVLGDGDAKVGYTLRLYRKPFVSWIWGGAALMAIGGGIAAFGRRQRKAVTQPAGATGAPAE